MTRCVGVTDELLNSIIKELPKLHTLNLYALPYLQCTFFKELSKKESSVLEYIDLCGNQYVTDDLFIGAMPSIKKLKYLNLSWCSKLTDKTIISSRTN